MPTVYARINLHAWSLYTACMDRTAEFVPTQEQRTHGKQEKRTHGCAALSFTSCGFASRDPALWQQKMDERAARKADAAARKRAAAAAAAAATDSDIGGSPPAAGSVLLS